jgi:hypothetical protein
LLVSDAIVVSRTDKCASELKEAGYGVYRRNKPEYREKARNWLLLLQPGIALFAAVGVILIFVFSSALWWDTTATAGEVFAVFGPVSFQTLVKPDLWYCTITALTLRF